MPLRWVSADTYSKLSSGVDGVDANEKEEFGDHNLFGPHERITKPSSLSRRAAISIFVAVALIASGAGFTTGVMISRNRETLLEQGNSAARVSINSFIKTFRYNESFATPPPTEGRQEPVWDSMIPNGLGYVNEPTSLGKGNLSVVSAFHQMHCLYTLRRAYYSNATGGEDFDFGLERIQHVAHCFEYLRQSIQCSADSTIEPAENAANGFLGWGFPRMCRDYAELSHWAEKRRAFDGHGFLAHPTIHSVDDVAQDS